MRGDLPLRPAVPEHQRGGLLPLLSFIRPLSFLQRLLFSLSSRELPGPRLPLLRLPSRRVPRLAARTCAPGPPLPPAAAPLLRPAGGANRDSRGLSAFLEAPFPVAFLRLRALLAVSGASWTGALRWGGGLLGAELQLSGAGRGVILGVLTEDVRVRGSILFAAVGGGCGLAEGGYAVELAGSEVDLGEK